MSEPSPAGPNPSPSLREAQWDFLAALRGPEAMTPAGVVPQRSPGTHDRLAVYRTAYRHRLVEVLRSDHPATASALGHDFESLALNCIAANPSRVYSLRDFGAAFPRFVGRCGRADAPSLGALAEFERTLLDAFDAPDAPPCSVELLARRLAEHGPKLRVSPHPSVGLHRPGWNVVEQWRAHKAGEPSPDRRAIDTEWIVWRGAQRRTNFRPASTDEAAVLRQLRARASVAELCEGLAAMRPAEQVPHRVAAVLRQLANDGALSSAP